MSEVRNIGAPFNDLHPVRVDRDREIASLAALSRHEDFVCREGMLAVVLPLALALEHVPDSDLREAVMAIEDFAGGVVRALVTLPSGAVPRWRSAQSLLDLPGQFIELGPDWSIRVEPRAPLGEDGPQDLAADEPGSAGVASGERGHKHLDDGAHRVEERRLLDRETSSVHPYPPVMRRRAEPPP
ncbi:hypothetical protein [Xanthobacter sediminis]